MGYCCSSLDDTNKNQLTITHDGNFRDKKLRNSRENFNNENSTPCTLIANNADETKNISSQRRDCSDKIAGSFSLFSSNYQRMINEQTKN